MKDLVILFPSEEGAFKVNVKEASVKSVENDILMNHYRYGLQFTYVEKTEKKALRNLIYRFQREFLRRR